MNTLAMATLVVREYDEAIAFYVGVLGFDLVEDSPLADEKRWVVVAPPGRPVRGAALLLARAASEEQRERIGDQTGGRVAFFLHTDDLARDHGRLCERGVQFVESPRHEEYGHVAVFEDLYGNRWDLVERSVG